MADRDELLALAARVEALTGACRATDAAILYEALGIMQNCAGPAYTASLDAAMTLVPEGWAFTVANWWCDGEKPPYFAECYDMEDAKAGGEGETLQAWAATPALALTAALRARAEQAPLDNPASP